MYHAYAMFLPSGTSWTTKIEGRSLSVSSLKMLLSSQLYRLGILSNNVWKKSLLSNRCLTHLRQNPIRGTSGKCLAHIEGAQQRTRCGVRHHGPRVQGPPRVRPSATVVRVCSKLRCSRRPGDDAPNNMTLWWHRCTGRRAVDSTLVGHDK